MPFMQKIDHAHPKYFWSTFNLCEFISTCKKHGYFKDLFWKYGWLKILQSENTLAHTLGTKRYPNMGFGTKNNINYRTNLVKINEKKNFNKFKKSCFGSIFGRLSQFLGAKKFSSKNPTLSCTISYGFLAPYQILEKINIITRKRLDRKKDRMTDRTYFIGPFRLPQSLKSLSYSLFHAHVTWNTVLFLRNMFVFLFAFIYFLFCFGFLYYVMRHTILLFILEFLSPFCYSFNCNIFIASCKNTLFSKSVNVMAPYLIM